MTSEAEILARKIFKTEYIKSIKKFKPGFEKKYKVIVFVPPNMTNDLMYAMASAGAGIIGNYTFCSFRTHGTGTFMGNADSNPAIGAKERFETDEEEKLEMICNKEVIEQVIDKLYEVHPYDEPAFEVYEVLTRTKQKNKDFFTVTFKKNTIVKNLLKMINPEIKLSNIPQKIKKTKVSQGIVDCSDNELLNLEGKREQILYIKKNNNKIKAYLI